MPPKKQKQSLADFLADETTGKVDWAEDLDELPLGPSIRDGPRRGTADYLSSMPDRADRDRMMGDRADRYPPREELPLPTKAPFTAFVGNLAFDATEADLADFFKPSATVSIRLVSDREGKAKGFGYVEFQTLDGLKDALSKSGLQMGPRTVRVSVAEAPKSSGPGFGPSVAEEASQWRRAGPLPPSDTGSGRPGPRSERPGFGQRFDSSGPSGFDNMEVGAGGRSGFGSRFAPGAGGPGGPAGAGGPGAGGPTRRMSEREAPEPGPGDEASNWRTGKPVESVTPPPRRPSGAPDGPTRGGSFRRSDATEVDERFANQERMGFGSKFAPSPAAATPPPDSPAGKKPGFGFDGARRGSGQSPAGGAGSAVATPVAPGPGDEADNWRSARKPSNAAASPAGGSPAPPAERKKLELKPRSTPVDGEGANEPAAASSSSGSRANPFGAAKPVDAAEREREIEERLAQKQKERKEKERLEREKLKAEREKAQAEAPKGPRRDRERGTASPGGAGTPAQERAGTPASNDGNAATAPARTDKTQNAWRRGPPAGGAKDDAAAAAAAPNGKAAASESTDSAPVPASGAAPQPPKPKPSLPPPGAWGKTDRKPSGALAGAAISSTTRDEATSTTEDAGVDKVAEDVAKASIDENKA